MKVWSTNWSWYLFKLQVTFIRRDTDQKGRLKWSEIFFKLFWAGFTFLALFAQPAFSTPANPERVYGWIEEGILLPENIAVARK